MNQHTFNAVNRDGARSVPVPSDGLAFETHYRPEELAELWGYDTTTIRRMFQDMPGVLKYGKSNRRDGKRDYVSIRIPKSVAERIHRELSK